MDNFTLLKELLTIYGGTTVFSLIFNRIYFKNRIQKAYDQSKRKIKYKELSMECSEDLSVLKSLCKSEKALCTFCSVIPIFQVLYTMRNIYLKPEDFNEFFDEMIEEINIKELNKRREYLEEMKQEKVLPLDIKEKINEEEYLPNEEDFLKVLIYRKDNNNDKQ